MSKILVTLNEKSYEVSFDRPSPQADHLTVQVNGETVMIQIPDPSAPVTDHTWMLVDERPYELLFDPDLRWVASKKGLHPVEIRDLEAMEPRHRSGDGRLKAPIPGLISRYLVQVGDEVKAGQPVVILEAMKMENEVRARMNGRVEAIHVPEGETVTRGSLLVEIS
ncbi:MAG: biotin attachment protein [Ardenticatenaceae bacterium]|nr:biotin/lipoyl-binding protein [Anaerolineales bacterium]MCB8937759.1 biotin attachment protein [Ardenticatenaceae bacterium]MCB8974328.1 biotin attachment protein [Ardenticatenaceae bacterium]